MRGLFIEMGRGTGFGGGGGGDHEFNFVHVGAEMPGQPVSRDVW